MKISLNWIGDYVALPEDITLKRLAYDLTMSTVEVEGYTELAQKFDNMVVGVIKEVLPHPNADKLRICKTDIGSAGQDGESVKDIVCGGSNLAAGQKVAVAIPGALVRWHGEGAPVSIGITKLRGVESYGMICASSEIGLSDLFPAEDTFVIVDLSAFDAPAGTPLAKALGLDDVILEIDNKSLTNRPDLWGHYGIAREIAALYDLPLRAPAEYDPQSDSADEAGASDFDISIKDSKRCPRYVGVRIEGLSVEPSPFSIQSRIWRVGMRPINTIVDVTNYVMLATGQPTHAFDSNRIKGAICVRRAGDGERLALLDGKSLALCEDDLVIADAENAVGLAGVMGGVKDSVLPDTTAVILEIANFEAISIRRTAARYETRTEAATRYEKAIDPDRCDAALSVAMPLFKQLCGDMRVTGFKDVRARQPIRNEIVLSLKWLRGRLGKDIPDDSIIKTLTALGFDVGIDGDDMRVVAPTWRSTGDVSIPDDILEEVARTHGFENFDGVPIVTVTEGAINQKDVNAERKLKEYLAFRCGMREIFSYPWISDEYADALFPDRADALSLATPPSPGESRLRFSLVPNLCKAINGNLRYYGEFDIFETAEALFDGDYSSPYDAAESLPRSRRYAAGAFVGANADYGLLYRRAKGVISGIPRYCHVEPVAFARVAKPAWADGAAWQNITRNGEVVGSLALLSQKAALGCGIKNGAAAIFELDVESMIPLDSRTNKYERLPDYPMTEYDISALFDSNVKWEDILSQINTRRGDDDFLRGVSFVGEYRGKQVPEGKKSVTLRLLIGSLEKTLTSADIDKRANAVLKKLEKTLGAKLREL